MEWKVNELESDEVEVDDTTMTLIVGITTGIFLAFFVVIVLIYKGVIHRLNRS